MSDYKPIDCSLHDRFEAACVRGDHVTIEWAEPGAASNRRAGHITDIEIRDRAEYLILDGEIRIRLDWITCYEAPI